MEQALLHAGDGVLMLDPDWRISYLNVAGGRFLRLDPTEALGRVLWDLYPEAEHGTFKEAYERALADGRPVAVEGWSEVVGAWFEARAHPYAGGLTVFFTDCTQRKLDEEERAGLVARLRLALDRSGTLLELSRRLGRAASVADVAASVTEVLGPAVGAGFCGIALVDRPAARVRYVSLYPLPESTGQEWAEFPLGLDAPPAVAARTGRALFHPDRAAAVAEFPDLGRHMDEAGAAALAHLPLTTPTATLGTLAVTWDRPHVLDAEDQAFLTTAAGIAAQAIERALLAEEQRRVLRHVQESLLPQSLPQSPVGTAAVYRPAGQVAVVGGDWYDAFTVPDGSVLLVVGDVTGHGVEAASTMARFRHACRIFAHEDPEPGAVLSRLNALVSGGTELATVACVRAAPDGRSLRYALAGHPSPLHLPSGRALDPGHRRTGPMLGLDPEAAYLTHDAAMEPDGALLLFTDGLVERRGVSLEEGIDLVRSYAAELVGAAAQGRAGTALAEVVDAVMLPEERRDDICALLAFGAPTAPAR
ncbi:MAG: SpoIIE family protein phosphatase [Actinotalea sp.]|nr:SpoIIE family protein phosphatase [Actinotalea sp.]